MALELSSLPIEIEYELTPDDLVEAALAQAARSPANRMIQRGVLLGGVGLILLMSLIAGGAPGMSIPLLFAAGLVFFQKLVTPRIQREHLRAMYQEGRNRALSGVHRMVLSQLNLTAIGPVSESRIRWYGVERIVTSESFVHFYLDAVRAHVIPRRAFGSSLAFEQFVAAARQLHAASLPPTPAVNELPPR